MNTDYITTACWKPHFLKMALSKAHEWLIFIVWGSNLVTRRCCCCHWQMLFLSHFQASDSVWWHVVFKLLNTIIVWIMNLSHLFYSDTFIYIIYACRLWRKQPLSQASHWSACSVVYFKHVSSCCCSAAFLPALYHNNRSVMRWARLSWGPDVAGLSVGRQQQPFPLSELPRGGGHQACVQPSNNQHSREAHSPLLLLFTTVYSVPLFTASRLKAMIQHRWLLGKYMRPLNCSDSRTANFSVPVMKL